MHCLHVFCSFVKKSPFVLALIFPILFLLSAYADHMVPVVMRSVYAIC